MAPLSDCLVLCVYRGAYVHITSFENYHTPHLPILVVTVTIFLFVNVNRVQCSVEASYTLLLLFTNVHYFAILMVFLVEN
jgi:hypothetical protein